MTIFITGNSRSGTTMMSRILGNHPEVFTFQELHFFDELLPAGNAEKLAEPANSTKLFATLCAIQRNGYFGSRNTAPFLDEAAATLKGTGNFTYAAVYEKFLQYETGKNHKKIPCEQTPQNIFALEDIFRNFKTAKIIVMVRDPRAVLLSQKNKWKRRKLSGGKIPFMESMRSRFNYHPLAISRLWKSVMITALQYKNNRDVLFVKYEDLIANPEAVIRNVCAHTGIPYDSGMLNIPVSGSSNFTDSGNNRGIDSSKTDQWKNGGLSAAEIHICQTVTAEQMTNFGYAAFPVNPSSLSVNWYHFSLPFRLGFALLFNLKRLKNPGKILKRFLR